MVLDLDLAGEGEAFLLNGFSLQIRLLFDWTLPEASWLGCGEEALFSRLRTACGVAGAEVALSGQAAGEGPNKE